MKKLHVSRELLLPPDTVTSTIVVYGGKGMGKTNLGSVLVEELAAAGLRFSVIDPMGVWWGLRHSESGKGKGIEVLILGGIHGDIPIEPTGGAVVADLVVDEDVSVVIDISRRPDGSMWSIGERIRFVTAYCKRLYQRQGEQRRPLMQVIDEAARFAPQIVRQGESDVAASMGAVAVLVEEGRNVGVGVTLITQRSARLNKDVAELADCMISFRVVGPNSTRAVLDWLGEHVEKKRLKEFAESLRALPRGSALVVSPGWLEFEGVIAFRARETFDSSATPKAGERQRKASGPGAKPDLSKYQARMKETIERVKAEDPRALQKRVAELQAELAKARHAKEPKTKVQIKEVYVLKDGQLKRLEALATRAEKVGLDFREAAGQLAYALKPAAQSPWLTGEAAKKVVHQQLADPALQRRMQAAADAPFRPAGARTSAARRPVPPPAPPSHQEDGHPVTSVEQRILDTIAGLEALGVGDPDKATVAALVGYHPNAKSYSNAVSHLHTTGRVRYGAGSKIVLTEGGRVIAHNSLPVSSRAELHELWFKRLGGVAERILRPLLDQYPAPRAIEEISSLAGYHPNAKSFSNMKSRLRTLGLIDYPEPGFLVATPVLFPEGLRP